MEDKGRYGCTANNSAGRIRAEFSLTITQPIEEDEGFDMAKTVIIAVCSAGAYLALVIGLTAFCSYRLLVQRRTRKPIMNGKNLKLAGSEFQHHREQHELLMKDRDSGMQFRSDSDNRSHASGESSAYSSWRYFPFRLSYCRLTYSHFIVLYERRLTYFHFVLLC